MPVQARKACVAYHVFWWLTLPLVQSPANIRQRYQSFSDLGQNRYAFSLLTKAFRVLFKVKHGIVGEMPWLDVTRKIAWMVAMKTSTLSISGFW